MLKTKIGNFLAFINGNSNKFGFNSFILRDPQNTNEFRILVFQTYGASASYEDSIEITVDELISHHVTLEPLKSPYSDSQARELLTKRFPSISVEDLHLAKSFPYFDFQDFYNIYHKRTNKVTLDSIELNEKTTLKFHPQFLICYSTDYLDPSQNDLIGYLDKFQIDQVFKFIYNDTDVTTPVDYLAILNKEVPSDWYTQGSTPALNFKYIGILDEQVDLNNFPLPIIKLDQTFTLHLGLDPFITYLTDKICKQHNRFETTFVADSLSLISSYKSEVTLANKAATNSGYQNYLTSKELGILNLLKIVNGEFYQKMQIALRENKVEFLNTREYQALTRLLYLANTLQHNPLFVAAVLVNIEPELGNVFKTLLSSKVCKIINLLAINALEKLTEYSLNQEQFIAKLQRNYHDLHTISTKGFSPDSLVNFDPNLQLFNEQTIAQSLKDSFGFKTRISRHLLRQYQYSWEKVKDFLSKLNSPIIFTTKDHSWIAQNLPTYCLEILAYQKHCFNRNNPFNTDREIYKQSFESFFKNFNERGQRGELPSYEDFVLIINHQNLVTNAQETQLALAVREQNKQGLNSLNLVNSLKKSVEDLFNENPQASYTLHDISPVKHKYLPECNSINTIINGTFTYANLNYVFSCDGLYSTDELKDLMLDENANKFVMNTFDINAQDSKKKIPIAYLKKVVEHISAITYGRSINNISFSYQTYIHPDAIRNFKIDDYHFSFLFSRGGKAIQAKYDFDAFVALAPSLFVQNPYVECADPIDTDLKSIQLRLVGKALQRTAEFTPSNELYDCSPILPRINDFYNHNPHYGLSKAQSQLAINYTIYQFVNQLYE